MDHCWDEHLCDEILKKAKDSRLKPSYLGDLLAQLIKRECREASDHASALIQKFNSDDERAREVARVAATMLWTCSPDCGWDVLWPVFQADSTFFRDVMTNVAYNARHMGSATVHLTDDQLADLFVSLVREFPDGDESDSDENDGDYVGPFQSVDHYREEVLGILKARGTASACSALERLVCKLPELSYLKWVLRAAKRTTLRDNWQPPTPSQLLELTKRRGSRFVRGELELLDVVIESLARLQDRLQGETPAARDVWDRQAATKSWRPVDENTFADHVVRHLKEDLKTCGIVALREVEISRGMGDGSGERTDIYVAAVLEPNDFGEANTVRVILEAKGCWHKELKSAMETQLRDRYLADAGCQHGLYLVGWFNCEHWDSEDYRRDRAPKWNVREAQEHFDAQAHSLSIDGCRLRAAVLDTSLR